jgi:DNA mismatch repair ATPase MutL
MARINVLPKEIYQLIAAGEVVERPSSVVKEMIENSLDAGAKNITLEIKNGGSTYIRITDDGCGIERDDVRKVFISHATSKISKPHFLISSTFSLIAINSSFVRLTTTGAKSICVSTVACALNRSKFILS